MSADIHSVHAQVRGCVGAQVCNYASLALVRKYASEQVLAQVRKYLRKFVRAQVLARMGK